MCIANSVDEELEMLKQRLTMAATMLSSALARAKYEVSVAQEILDDAIKGDSNHENQKPEKAYHVKKEEIGKRNELQRMADGA